MKKNTTLAGGQAKQIYSRVKFNLKNLGIINRELVSRYYHYIKIRCNMYYS